MQPILNFFGDTARILWLIAMFALSLALNTALFALSWVTQGLINSINMYGLLTAAYAGKIKAVLDKPLRPSDDTKGTVH